MNACVKQKKKKAYGVEGSAALQSRYFLSSFPGLFPIGVME